MRDVCVLRGRALFWAAALLSSCGRWHPTATISNTTVTALSLKSATVYPGQDYQLLASGGAGNYRFDMMTSDGGTLTNGGLFSRTLWNPGTAQVRVTDGSGATQTAPLNLAAGPIEFGAGSYSQIGYSYDGGTLTPFLDNGGQLVFPAYTDGDFGGVQDYLHGTDFALVTLQASGKPRSTHQLGPGFHALATGTAVVYRAGSTYFAGVATSDGIGGLAYGYSGGYQLVAGKYAADGTLSWAAQYGSTPGDIILSSTSLLDSAQNTYVGCAISSGFLTGSLIGTHGGSDAGLVSFDANGNLRWALQWGSSTGITGLLSDGANGVYAQMYADMNSSIQIVHVDATGAVVWTTTIAHNLQVNLNGFFRKSTGEVIVVGNLLGSAYGTQALGGAVGKYDTLVVQVGTGGTIDWTAQLGGGAGKQMGGNAVLGTDDAIYLGGVSDATALGTIYGAGHGNKDGYLAKVNANGTFAWAAQFAGGAGTSTLGAVSLDSAGNVYFTGTTSGAVASQAGTHGTADLLIAKVDSTGTFLWSKQIGGGGTVQFNYAFDPNNSYEQQIFCFVDAIGQCGIIGSPLQFDTSQNPYVAGQTTGSLGAALWETGVTDTFVAKLTPAGAVTWLRQFGRVGATLVANPLVFDGSGTTYLSGKTDTALNGAVFGNTGYASLWVLKLDASGVLQ